MDGVTVALCLRMKMWVNDEGGEDFYSTGKLEE